MSAATDHARLREGTPTTFYDGAVRIPGQRAAPNRCRDYKPVAFCEAGHTVLGRSSCGTRYCPDHWNDWCEDAVIGMVARLAAYREAREGAEKRLSHVVASPPQDRRYGVRGLWDVRSDAYDALEEAGVRGGAAILHPYRTNDRGDALFETATEQGDAPESVGKWSLLRDATDGWDELSRYVEAAPHVHTLAAAEDVDGEAAPGDWVVKRVRTFQPFYYQDTEAYRDMAAAAYYVLTHAADQEGKQTTTYFGEVHPATFDPEEELTAAKWDRIQREAEKAVKTRREDHEGAGPEPPTCDRDGCDELLLELEELPERLSGEWGENLPPDRRQRLRGVLVWYEGRGDRPPPGAAVDETRLLAWLHEVGGRYQPSPGRPDTQLQLPTEVFAGAGPGVEYGE